MNNNVLISYAASIVPILTLVFVGFLLVYKIYIKVRSKFGVNVNCWFCNENSKVPYLESNSWTCSKCEQYNGFTKDGDYNREIIQQFDCSASSVVGDSPWRGEQAQNGFCNACNEAQRLKVEKLSQFEPKKESRFDEEFKVYKEQLEEQYRLCTTCDRHLKMVLRGKKKMVLGSKFLEYVMEGAKSIKQSNYLTNRLAKEGMWKRRLSTLVTIMTIINLFCLLNALPELNRSWFLDSFGVTFGSKFFIFSSHLIALWRVLTSFITTISENESLIKLGLFSRTVFMMLLYSLGLRLPQIVRLNFSSFYMLTAPFCILVSTFFYNLIDKFKLTRYTFMLAIWGIYTGVFLDHSWQAIQHGLMVLTSMITCVLIFTNKVENSPKLYDKTANSFHKIYAEDYLSDTDTITSSYLNGPLDCSSTSAHSNASLSFKSLKRSNLQKYSSRSPLLTSSTLSLNQSTCRNPEYTLNSSFKSCCDLKKPPLRSRFGSDIYSSHISSNPFFGSSPDVFSTQKSQPTLLFANPTNFQTKEQNNFNQTCQTRSILTPLPRLGNTFFTSNKTHVSERPAHLLSTSRFNMNDTASGYAISNSFRQSNEEPKQQASSINYQHIPSRFGNLNAINEDISRASSRSSGFESQNGYLNNSRENSFCAESNDLNRPTNFLDNSRMFQPVENQSFQKVPVTATHSLFSPSAGSTFSQPLSVNCGTEWHSNRNLNDSFNLRQFNQDLPSVRRGELLRKWMEKESFVSSN